MQQNAQREKIKLRPVSTVCHYLLRCAGRASTRLCHLKQEMKGGRLHTGNEASEWKHFKRKFNFLPWKGLFLKLLFLWEKNAFERPKGIQQHEKRRADALLKVLSRREGRGVRSEQREQWQSLAEERRSCWGWSLIVNQDISLGDCRPWSQLDNSICQAHATSRAN